MFKRGIFLENIKIALQAIKAQMLRSILTGLIIAIGITALVGILTSIDAIESKLTGQFALLGANTFTIQNRGPNIQIGRRGQKPKVYPPITFYQARTFKDRFDNQPALVSTSFVASSLSEVRFQSNKTNPDVRIWAIDENYIKTAGYEIAEGRNITEAEVNRSAKIALIGQDIKDILFPNTSPLGEIIDVGGKRYRVVGLMASKGNSFGMGGDKAIFIPITTARSAYNTGGRSFSVNVMSLLPEQVDAVVGEATATMRAVRKLPPKEETNFTVTKSDNLSQMMLSNLGFIRLAGIFIGIITLLGAAIALLNMMLVSVTERTREIGVRKAIGAKANTILGQFLMEAINICLFGGLAGMLFGIGIGNIVSALIDGQFIIPWLWMILSVILCIVVGLLAGIYPAFKASRTDPIESLRYE